MRIRPLRRTFCADRRSEAVLDTLPVTGWDGIIKLNEAEVDKYYTSVVTSGARPSSTATSVGETASNTSIATMTDEAES